MGTIGKRGASRRVWATDPENRYRLIGEINEAGGRAGAKLTFHGAFEGGDLTAFLQKRLRPGQKPAIAGGR